MNDVCVCGVCGCVHVGVFKLRDWHLALDRRRALFVYIN